MQNSLFSKISDYQNSPNNVELEPNIENNRETPAGVIYSVSELSELLKKTISDKFSFIQIKGEISGLKVAASGHMYFNIKDDKSIINAICWRNTKLPVRLEDGLEVVCSGSITIYNERSSYQIIVNKIELKGEGAILAIIEKRKQKFAALGYFNSERKKMLPLLPKTIAVITSPQGAVIRDILHRIADRFPVRVLIWGVAVQGSEAAGQVANAIRGLHRMPAELGGRPDLIIVARGGGSIEDLMPFSEEIVIEAAFQAEIPIISAIGHETDYSLLDLVADKRAPTPTAAAEFAVPVRVEIMAKLHGYREQLNNLMTHLLQNKKLQMLQIHKSIQKLRGDLSQIAYKIDKYYDLLDNIRQQKLQALRAQLENCKIRMNFNLIGDISKEKQNLAEKVKQIDLLRNSILDSYKTRLEHCKQLMASYDVNNILARGFAIVSEEKSGKTLRNASEMREAESYNVRFQDGVRRVVAAKNGAKSE